ncbi:MAG: hypothetical protein AAB487_03510 [Patescibacteria group bacterium]|mgnify:CR=1
MTDVKEIVFFYIARLFEEINDECFERNQRAAGDGTSHVVVPKCPYHLLCNIERNRDGMIWEIEKAELFLESFLGKKLPRRPTEVSEWLAKK